MTIKVKLATSIGIAFVYFFMLNPVLFADNLVQKTSATYVSFLKKEHARPVDYVLQLFDQYDLVILCERVHTESTQWDFIYELVSDQRFIDHVGNIFTEYGVINLQPDLDRFMQIKNLSPFSGITSIIPIS
jgi:hypothetical protein